MMSGKFKRKSSFSKAHRIYENKKKIFWKQRNVLHCKWKWSCAQTLLTSFTNKFLKNRGKALVNCSQKLPFWDLFMNEEKFSKNRRHSQEKLKRKTAKFMSRVHCSSFHQPVIIERKLEKWFDNKSSCECFAWNL